jgi:hypothetical protein
VSHKKLFFKRNYFPGINIAIGKVWPLVGLTNKNLQGSTMNILKKLLLSIAFVGAFGITAGASAVTITSPTNSTDVYLSSSRGEVHSTSFDLNISGFTNGFVTGVDTLKTVILSIFLKDDKALDGNDVYKITLGSGSNTQNVSGNNFSDDIWSWGSFSWVLGTAFESITLDTKALNDLRPDGKINVTIEATSGDFIFDKAYLTADVTRGVIASPPASVPEPTTIALLGLGLLGFAASRRKSAKSKNA